MSRWIVLIGIVFASILMFRFDDGRISTRDVVNYVVNPVIDVVDFVLDDDDEDEGFSVLAFGDMMMGRYVRIVMEREGMDYPVREVEHLFDEADVLFGNLEGPINGEGRKGGTSMVFSFNEDIAPWLASYGFDVVSIANNHAVDQGWDGRGTTIEALNGAGVGWCGHPTEVDAESVYYGEKNGTSFAFICFNDVVYGPLDDSAAIELISEVDEEVDLVFVSIHWGVEYRHVPDSKMQVLPGRSFVNAGADVVIGHHPHVVQSFEIFNGKPIFYSLGNFIFDQYWSGETQEELAIKMEFEDELMRIHLLPMYSEKSKSRLMTEEEYGVWIEEFLGYAEYDAEMTEMIREGVIEIEM